VSSLAHDAWWVSRELAMRYGWSRDEVRAVPLSELSEWLKPQQAADEHG